MKKIILICLLISLNTLSQTSAKLDSLYTVLKTVKSDTSIINTWNRIAEEYVYSMPDSTKIYAQKAKLASEKIDYALGNIRAHVNLGSASYLLGESNSTLPLLIISIKKGEELVKKENNFSNQKAIGSLYNIIGNNYFVIGNVDSAYVYYKLGLNTFNNIQYKKGIASGYVNCSNIESMRGDATNAMKHLFEALKISEQINDKKIIAFCYNNIAKLYNEQNDLDKGLEYFKKAVKVGNEIKLLNITSIANYNISNLLLTKNKLSEAIPYAEKSVEESKLMNSEARVATSLILLGNIYLAQNKIELAISDLNEAIRISEKIGDQITLANAHNSISNVYFKIKDYKKAIIHSTQSLQISKQTKNLSGIQTSSKDLFELYKKDGKFKNALDMLELSLAMKDSIVNKNNQKELINQELKYSYDKQAIADSLKYENNKKIQQIENQANLKTQRNKQIALLVGLVLAVIAGGILFNRFKVTQKQKSVIETQSHKLEITHAELESKTKEIKDSILYSKEIQNVFLKPITENPKYYDDCLLIYKPKDVVSGDFYWYKDFNDKLFVVIGDCTGHGVPGAIISVLAIQTLERIIVDVKEPKNLHELNELLNNEFKIYNSKNDMVNIGLDYSIMCLDKTNKKMYLSGSGSSILVKNINNQLIQEKFESLNIGGEKPIKYEGNTKTFNIEDIHAVFLYTDGIIDQRGGANNKRFTSMQLKELITGLNTNNSEVAYQKIEHSIINWQGDNNQMDDMTLFAIQFKNI